MSMNLNCNHIELRQTPTWVTWMCMAEPDGYSCEFKGKKARRALQAYMLWRMSEFSSFAGTDKEWKVFNEHREYAQEHCDCVRDILKKKGLVVWAM